MRVLPFLGRPGTVLISHVNVTARKWAEETLQRRDLILEAAAHIGQILLSDNDLDRALSSATILAGQASGQDRSYIFEVHESRSTGEIVMSMRHEWVREGIIAQISNPELQNFPIAQVAPYSYNMLSRNLPVCELVRNLPESERSVLEPQNIVSILLMPISVNKRLWGLIGYDNCHAEYVWSAGEMAALGVVAASIGGAIARMRAEEEKTRLQGQLQQSQKMEMVGQLAGGIAHDFNNMLSVILGYAELALMKPDLSPSLLADLKEMVKAAERSADLTRQLLAFARKQTVAPEVLDLNETVAGMLKMMQRLIGEDIDLNWRPKANLWPVKVDPSQIDQILANLCVNARDAISGVGKMTIETGNSVFDEEYCSAHEGFVAGEYVQLAVSDNGCGMERETLARIFEPFFTTKELGKGTGLGLATVYGAVKQNNGFINAYSEPNQGTTFTIYLPRYVHEAQQTLPESPALPVARGNETILLVEDEPSILEMTAKMLAIQGYTVLAASTPEKAMCLADEHAGRIHLLMTDVVLPEMNGRELSERLQTRNPDLACLFMSGYTADIIAHRGVLDKGVHFIQKPFSITELSIKLREVLDTTS
ncbi:MAG: response regulator [Desulfuromonadales bacterium]|nr:response regulator [Desulfuromonadales bacterium]